MEHDELYQCAIDSALELPASEYVTLDDGWEVIKVHGKWFALLSLPREHVVTLKADPEDALALMQEFPSITPGYHMNKKHWITLHASADITAPLVKQLVCESYLAVVSKLPKALRPVNPETFGRSLSFHDHA